MSGKGCAGKDECKSSFSVRNVGDDAIDPGIRASNKWFLRQANAPLSAARKRKLKDLDKPGWQNLMAGIVRKMKPLLRRNPGARPWFRGVQRRYRPRAGRPHIDAQIDFDLRTAFPSAGPPKMQPQWLSAAYNSFLHKRHSNYQMQVGVVFRYDQCPELRRAAAIQAIAEAWLACGPMIEKLDAKR